MNVRIQFDDNLIELSFLERAPRGVPNEGDVHVSVLVNLGKFSAFHKSVWLEERVLKVFINQLGTLELTRKGVATLEACSPEDFRLEIRSRDTLGHLVVEIWLCQYQYSGPTYWPTKLSGGFEIDPCSIKSVLDDFKRLHVGG